MDEKRPKLLIGTSGWTYDHWRGLFYPAELPKSRWFGYYSGKFSTIEINATFYRTFKDQTYHKWREQVGAGFRYVLKVPRVITHRKYLADARDEIQAFWNSASLLEDRLGLLLLQVAPATPYDLERLKQALLAFRDPKRVAVEFRHRHWFDEEVCLLLKELGAVFCNADSPKTRLTDRVTSDAANIRLHGRKHWYSYDYSVQELEEIARLALGMAERGAETVYIFFNNDFEGYAPKNALALMEILGLESAAP